MGAAAPPTIPRARNGRVEWKRLDGFVAWFKATAGGLTNPEMVAAIQHRYGVAVTRAVITSLRAVHDAPQSPEARRRAYTQRTAEAPPPPPPRDPREKLEVDTLTREVHSLRKRATLFEVIGEKMARAIANVPRLPAPPVPRRVKVGADLSEEEMLLLISDVQAGLLVESGPSGGIGDFGFAVIHQQAEYLKEAVLRIRKYHGNVNTLHVAFLGDMIEGSAIYAGQLRQVEDEAVQQVLWVKERFARFLRDLAAEFPRVKCYGVIGNHGRVHGKPGEFSPLNNLDYLLYHYLRDRLENVKNLAWDIAGSWWQIATIQGWRFLLVHGDDAGLGWAGIPFYAIGRHAARYREVFRTSSAGGLAEVDDFDFLVVGHHSETAGFKNCIMNGSWPGGTEFSLKKLQLNAIPQQTLLGVHHAYGVSWRRDINLRPLRPRRVARAA